MKSEFNKSHDKVVAMRRTRSLRYFHLYLFNTRLFLRSGKQRMDMEGGSGGEENLLNNNIALNPMIVFLV